MIVLDKTPDRFTPPELEGQKGAPVYLIQPTDLLGKAAFRRELRAMGVSYPSTAELMEALRAGIRAGLAEDQQQGFLDLLDRAEDHRSAMADAVRAVAEADEEEREGLIKDMPQLSEADAYDLNTLERDMHLHYPPYAELLADRTYYLEVAPILAAQHFLVGWENVDARFTRKRGVVALDLLESAMPEDRIKLIGNRAMTLMQPSRDEAKNSASRPGSPAGRGTSKAGSGRSTARPGKSKAKSTKKTPAS